MPDMTDPAKSRREVEGTNSSVSADLTGRDRMVRNTLTSWGSQLVFVVSGFILPRFIDGRMGQELLGVWDFGWAVVAYFSLVTAGVISSINRYVARERARGDTDAVNRAVSSVSCVLVVMTAVIVALAVGAALAVPHLLSERLGPHAGDAQWVVLFLGLSVSLQILFSGIQGTLTGCHRYDVHNGIEAGMMGVTLVGAVLALCLGGNLPHIAAIVLVGRGLGAAAMYVVAHRLFPWLSIRPSHARWATARSMLAFGGKSFVPHVGELVLNATTGVFVVAFLGPAALAIYSRPKALVRIARTIVSKFAFLLTPVASSLQAMDRSEEIKALLVKGTRYGAFIALPMVLGLAIMGGPLLRLWMGPKYADSIIPLILAVGSAAFILQLPAVSVLRGMNAHGRPGLANSLAGISSIALMYCVLGPMGWGLPGVAVAVVLPYSLVNVFYIPRYACGRLKMPLWSFLYRSFRAPVLCMAPFTMALAGPKLLLRDEPFAALVWGTALGGSVLCVLYWRFALPESLKARILRTVTMKSPPADSRRVDVELQARPRNADERA